MPIDVVAAGDPVRASKINAIIAQANKVPDAYTAGSVLVAASAATYTTTATSMTKLWEMYVPVSGTLRVVFTLEMVYDGSYPWTVSARIYRNGGAVGTSRSLTPPSGGPYTASYSEDIGSFAVGDLLQIYASQGITAAGVAISEIRIRAAETGIAFINLR